ncbi:MAG TPA: chlorite dismutase family protein [bacterium]
MTRPGSSERANVPPDIRERGAPVRGEPQTSARRLFVQLQVFTGCRDAAPLGAALAAGGAEGAVYLDLHDPRGVGIVLLHEDPAWFVTEGRRLLDSDPFAGLSRRTDYAMFGRTYATGHEADLEDWLLAKPRRSVLNPSWPWAVWYPLRRKSEFALVSPEEQSRILAEHARMGMAYGRAGYAADIRLACHGLDARDNEFVLGLVGPELAPLSLLVQDMRKSQQTAKYISTMGPFFVGRAVWQSPAPPARP